MSSIASTGSQPAATTTAVRTEEEDVDFGDFEPITASDRERYGAEFKNAFPHLGAILDGASSAS